MKFFVESSGIKISLELHTQILVLKERDFILKVAHALDRVNRWLRFVHHGRNFSNRFLRGFEHSVSKLLKK